MGTDLASAQANLLTVFPSPGHGRSTKAADPGQQPHRRRPRRPPRPALPPRAPVNGGAGRPSIDRFPCVGGGGHREDRPRRRHAVDRHRAVDGVGGGGCGVGHQHRHLHRPGRRREHRVGHVQGDGGGHDRPHRGGPGRRGGGGDRSRRRGGELRRRLRPRPGRRRLGRAVPAAVGFGVRPRDGRRDLRGDRRGRQHRAGQLRRDRAGHQAARCGGARRRGGRGHRAGRCRGVLPGEWRAAPARPAHDGRFRGGRHPPVVRLSRTGLDLA